MIDIIVNALLIIFFAIGFRDGVFRTLMGPIALFLGTVWCIIFYNITHNFIGALAISAIAPIILKFFFNKLLKFWNKIKKGEEELSLPSRIGGGFLSLAWCGTLLALTLTLIAVIPTEISLLVQIQNKIVRSTSFDVINFLSGGRIRSHADELQNTVEFFKDPEKIKNLHESKEFKDLMENKKIKEIFSDERILKQIEKKNLTQLMNNEKIQSIMNDKELLKKIFEANKRMIKEKIGKTSPKEEE